MEEDIKEEIKLDSPLVVHKEGDASYQECASDFDMNATHTDEDSDVPTLQRHRFRKEKKSKKGLWIILCLIAVVVAVFCALIQSGTISLKTPEPTTKVERTYTTQKQNDFSGIITIKGFYIFFEGEEIDGVQALEKELKYIDKNKKFIIQDENANNNFLNYDILPLFTKYEIKYETTHIVSSGLKSKYETTTKSTTTTTTTKPTSQKAEENNNVEVLNVEVD